MFLFEHWVKHDQAQVQEAFHWQNEYVSKKIILKEVTHRIQTLPEDDPNVHELILMMEEKRKEVRALVNDKSAFEMINASQEMLSYKVDFHCGLRKIDAEEVFNRIYFNILSSLRTGRIQSNTSFKNEHIIKVITGYGHHDKEKDPVKKGRLKQHFLQYFTRNLFDFAYSENIGVFLVRVKY